jgi:hypothetical protein
MEYPKSWQRLLEEHHSDIESGNLALYNPADSKNQTRTLGVVFKVADETSESIAKLLHDKVPTTLKDKIIFQPANGFHFTIQWAPEEYLNKVNVDLLWERIQQSLTPYSVIQGDLSFPFVGRAGLFGLLDTKTNDDMLSIRQAVHKIWEAFNLPTGLNPKDYDLAYISTARYMTSFTQAEIAELMTIKPEVIEGVKLDEVRLVINDKFMTIENTPILQIMKLPNNL